MAKITPTTITSFLLLPLTLVASMLLYVNGFLLHAQLTNSQIENAQLREAMRTQVACAPVQVTCVCPTYEEGWDDSEFAEGCAPAPIELEQIELVCAELKEFGYVPGC